MKATILPEVVRYFSLNRPLRGEQLQHWFVERDETPRHNLMNMLRYQDATDCPKILFAGQRGNGKSTELNKLAQELQDVFHVVNFSIRMVPGLVDLEYEDLMVAIYTQMIKYCFENKLLQPALRQHIQPKLEKIHTWWRQVVSGLGVHARFVKQLWAVRPPDNNSYHGDTETQRHTEYFVFNAPWLTRKRESFHNLPPPCHLRASVSPWCYSALGCEKAGF